MARKKAHKGNSKKVVGYIRVSTSEQHLGPVAQRDAITAWCKVHGAELVAVFTDQISGGASLDKRVVLMDAIDAVKTHGAGVLAVAKRDRLARDTINSAMVSRLVTRNGATIVSTDGTGNGEGPEAQLMRTMIDGFAEYERALIRARTKAAMAVKLSRGEKCGGKAPFGYMVAVDGIHWIENPTEQRVVELVAALRADGLSYRAIVDRLNSDGVPARGSRWHQTSVIRMMERNAA